MSAARVPHLVDLSQPLTYTLPGPSSGAVVGGTPAHPLTAEAFERITGNKPHDDDLARVNCPDAGRIGHLFCGWCGDCCGPRFVCGHT